MEMEMGMDEWECARERWEPADTRVEDEDDGVVVLAGDIDGDAVEFAGLEER